VKTLLLLGEASLSKEGGQGHDRPDL
jgi:hypothetical protein